MFICYYTIRPDGVAIKLTSIALHLCSALGPSTVLILGG